MKRLRETSNEGGWDSEDEKKKKKIFCRPGVSSPSKDRFGQKAPGVSSLSGRIEERNKEEGQSVQQGGLA